MAPDRSHADRSPLARYTVAIAATLAATVAGIGLHAWVGYRFPLIAFFPAVMLSAWYGGLWPGLTTTVLSTVVIDRLWLAPLRAGHLATAGDPIALSIFLGAGLAIAGFSESLHRSTARERHARERAEERERALHESERRLHLALEAAQAARTDAETANHLKDQFLATVSHELRTPLNALLGWADMLERGTLPEHRRHRAVEAIHANAQRQAQLVDDLLDIARMMSGKLYLQRAAVNMADIIRSVVDVVQASADAKHIELTVDVDAAIGSLDADGSRLQQVFWNLLSNAIKFTPEHGVVNIRAHEANAAIEVAISDTGRGIPPNLRASIFEPFHQADSSTTRVHGGLGLGLSIVKYLVDAHGGTVTAESAGEGRGATFTVSLPAAHAADRPSAHPEPATSTRPFINVSVLIVDDDPDTLEVIAACLECQGVRVLTARSAHEAFEVLERDPPTALLVDVAMPDEDGYSLIRRIRRAPSSATASIPAAALTAFAKDDDRRRALAAGFQDHIPKPVTSAELTNAVARLVDGARA